jgi:hemoglobin
LNWTRTATAALLSLVLAACSGMPPAHEASLYDRLGGQSAIVAVVDDFVANVTADPRVNGFFATTDLSRFKQWMVQLVCLGSGGPCIYTGRDMKTAHAGMGITDADFDAVVSDLTMSLEKFKLPAREKNELLGLLATMRYDIVTR